METPPHPPNRGRFSACLNSKWCLVLVALAIRLVVMGFLYQEQLDPERDHWRFAYENGRIARSIATGHGFSSPLFEDTGLTGFLTPVYPYFMAGIFKTFGIYSTTSAFVLLISNAIISSLTCLPVFFFARKTFGDRVAVWSGWAWALFPYAVYFSVERIWATWLSTLLLSVLFLLTLQFERPVSIKAWIGYGLLWGFAALTEPIVLTVLPIMLGWIGIRLLQKKQSWFIPLSVASITIILFVTPWFLRNYEVFHRFVPFRDTMGLELMIGNNGDTFHWRPRQIGPWHNDADWQKFKQMGELAYMDEKKVQALEYIRGHKSWFAWVTVRRFVYIWTGYWSLDPRYLVEEPLDPANIFFSTSLTVLALIGLRRVFREHFPVAALYATMLLVFPVVFYFTHVEVYYRRQVDPQMVVLAVYGVLPWFKSKALKT